MQGSTLGGTALNCFTRFGVHFPVAMCLGQEKRGPDYCPPQAHLKPTKPSNHPILLCMLGHE